MRTFWPLVTSETSLREIKRIHREIWQYVVDHGEKPETPYRTNCVLCEYCALEDVYCYTCPAKVNAKEGDARCLAGLYEKFLDAKYKMLFPKLRARYFAKKIRDIPFKTEDEMAEARKKYKAYIEEIESEW